MKLSNQEKKELDRFTKFLALKAAQVIVQSRLGEKISRPCKPQVSSTDFFNLDIPDLPDVLAESKRVLNGEVLSAHPPLCIEISLTTIEGDQMVLETWSLSLLPEQCEPTERIVPIVYQRMGVLLKSLLTVTRVLPAYKLSRRQGPESFVICYRIYMDEPQFHNLGEGYKYVRVGQTCTPIGTIELSVTYRTKMTISPTQTGGTKDSMLLKSNHFDPNLTQSSTEENNQNEEKIPSLNDKMKIGAFADYHKKKLFEQELIIPNLPTLGKLFPDDIFSDRRSDNNESSGNAFNNSKNSAASKKEEKDSKKGEKKQDKKDEKKDKKNGNASSPTAELTSQIDSLTMVSTNDDFIMKTPFASVTEKSSELGRFYQEWQTAPPLQEFVDLAPLEQTELTKQLETFESQVKEYENIVQSLCQSPNNN